MEKVAIIRCNGRGMEGSRCSVQRFCVEAESSGTDRAPESGRFLQENEKAQGILGHSLLHQPPYLPVWLS